MIASPSPMKKEILVHWPLFGTVPTKRIQWPLDLYKSQVKEMFLPVKWAHVLWQTVPDLNTIETPKLQKYDLEDNCKAILQSSLIFFFSSKSGKTLKLNLYLFRCLKLQKWLRLVRYHSLQRVTGVRGAEECKVSVSSIASRIVSPL